MDLGILLAGRRPCFKAGYPFGVPISTTSDAVQWVGAMFNSYGAQLVDAKGEITVRSDATRSALEWSKKTVRSSAERLFGTIPRIGADFRTKRDDLQRALGMGGGKRDAPKVAEQLWTFPAPKGPKGRHISGRYRYWGIWNFSANKSAAKSLLLYLSRARRLGSCSRPARASMCRRSRLGLPAWAAAEPPEAVVQFPAAR